MCIGNNITNLQRGDNDKIIFKHASMKTYIGNS